MLAGKSIRSLTLAAGALAALSAAPARGDWLVTLQGDRIETRGPWQEKGKLVVFHRPDGTLSSLRLSEVDLESSRAATSQAQEEKEQPSQEEAKPKRPSVAKLTDKDFQRTAPSPAPAAEPEKAKEDKAAADKKPVSVSVASWERGKSPGDGHVVITGTLRNTTENQATASGVTVLLFDETGAPLSKVDAVLTSTVIPGGGSVGFQAEFPGLFAFAAAKFETRSLNLGAKPGAPPAIPSNPS